MSSGRWRPFCLCLKVLSNIECSEAEGGDFQLKGDKLSSFGIARIWTQAYVKQIQMNGFHKEGLSLPFQCAGITQNANIYSYGLRHEGAAVLLPGFAIKW